MATLISSLADTAIAQERSDSQVDRFGDPLPNGARRRLGTSRMRHDWDCTSIAFLRSTNELCSVARDGRLCIWDPKSGKLVASASPDKFELTACAATSNGEIVVAGALSGGIARFVRSTQELSLLPRLGRVEGIVVIGSTAWIGLHDELSAVTIDSMTETEQFHGAWGHVRSMKVSNAGVIGFCGDDGRVYTLDTRAHSTRIQSLQVSGARSVAFVDDRHLVVGTDTGVKLLSLDGSPGKWGTQQPPLQATALATTTDRDVVCGTVDGHVVLLHGATGEVKRELGRHAREVRQVDIDPTAPIAYTACADGSIGSWALSESQQGMPFDRGPHSQPVEALAASDEHDVLVSATPTSPVAVWVGDSSVATYVDFDLGAPIAVARSGNAFAAVDFKGVVRVMGLRGAECRPLKDLPARRVTALALDTDASVLCVADEDRRSEKGSPSRARIAWFTTSDWSRKWDIEGETAGMAIRPGGSGLAVGGYREVRFIDVETGKDVPQSTVSMKGGWVSRLSYTADGRSLVATTDSEYVVVDTSTYRSERASCSLLGEPLAPAAGGKLWYGGGRTTLSRATIGASVAEWSVDVGARIVAASKTARGVAISLANGTMLIYE